MKDRIPTYPGRVKLTPVSGQENTYDMVRADEPTQEGTPLNKASLLQDETAALYGQGADAVPNDILSILSKAVLNVDGNLQDIGGSKVGTRIATGSYVGTGTYGYFKPSMLTFDFIPKLVMVQCNSLMEAIHLLVINGITTSTAYMSATNSTYGLYISWNGNTITWYSENAAGYQMNNSGNTYRWLAIA